MTGRTVTNAPTLTGMRRPTLLLLVPIVGLALAGCGSGGGRSDPSAAAAPSGSSAAALRAVAAQELNTYSAGQYGAAWDLWDSAGQHAISRADYVALFTRCRDAFAGVGFKITSATVSGTAGTVATDRGGVPVVFAFNLEDGRWRYQPPATDMADYKLGLDATVAKDKAEGVCGT